MSRKKPPAAAVSARREGMPTAITGGAFSADERRLSFGDRWVYAPAFEQSDHLKIKPRYQVFIDGKFCAPRSGRYFDSINPATEEKLAEIAEADARDVDLAVQAARRAQRKVWSKMHGRERGKFLYRIARLIQENRGNSRCSNHWMAGRRSGRAGTSICPWSRRISFTTRVGRTSSNTRFPAVRRVR